MTVDAPQLPGTPQPSATPPAPTANAASESAARLRWGSLQALGDDATGAIFEASVAQALADQSWTIFLRILPTQENDMPPPPDSRDTKLMTSAFVTEHFVDDEGRSALTEPVKTGAIRTMTLAGDGVPEKLITCDVRFNMDRAVKSSFIRRLLGSLGNDDDRTPLDIASRAEWIVITPAVQDPDYRFALVMQPSTKALNTGLTAYSEKSPREVKTDICAALKVTEVPAHIAIFRRSTVGGLLTEIVCWDHMFFPSSMTASSTLALLSSLLPRERATNPSARCPSRSSTVRIPWHLTPVEQAALRQSIPTRPSRKATRLQCTRKSFAYRSISQATLVRPKRSSSATVQVKSEMSSRT